MNREDIIRMAREADREWDCDRDMVEWLEWFAALVAAAEREECAKIVEQTKWSNWFQADCAAAIRARGETTSRGQTAKTCPPCHGDCNQGRTCPARGGHA